ncbi:hypothetical protein [Paenibacillus lemnae]|uniref:Uncharacterized protein n=1 Tax=Paenibacillus lemnae TaxID=1330551 RepID=A0A848M4A2_PAELE|nr:hypothetical protein [Paenibacillus lemnae]NMO94932.1 hypothetical protein [Paenibacillus lemnae]
MKKKIIGLIIVVGFIYVVTDLTLAFLRYPTLYSHVNRITDQAPQIHLNEKALIYAGSIKTDANDK